MNLAQLIVGSSRRALPARSALDRRWCSDRRLAERRCRVVPVPVDRRRSADRRTSSERRCGTDRRGNLAVKSLFDQRCGKLVGGERRCGQPAILRSPSGWRCFWHLDRRFDRRSA